MLDGVAFESHNESIEVRNWRILLWLVYPFSKHLIRHNYFRKKKQFEDTHKIKQFNEIFFSPEKLVSWEKKIIDCAVLIGFSCF